MKKSRFRIVQEDGVFYIQKRVVIIFFLSYWSYVTSGGGGYETVGRYYTLEDAERDVKELMNRPEGRKVIKEY